MAVALNHMIFASACLVAWPLLLAWAINRLWDYQERCGDDR